MKRAPDDFDLPDINVPSIDLGADVELPSVAGADERDQADIDIEKQAAAELEALRSDFQKRAKNEEKASTKRPTPNTGSPSASNHASRRKNSSPPRSGSDTATSTSTVPTWPGKRA
jgi:hypothetical protein